MKPVLRWLIAALAGSAAAYLAWLSLLLASQALLGILGRSDPPAGPRIISDVLSHGAAGAAFVLAASRVAPRGRRTPAVAWLLLVLILGGLVAGRALAWPVGEQLTGALAVVAGGAMAGGILAGRRSRSTLGA